MSYLALQYYHELDRLVLLRYYPGIGLQKSNRRFIHRSVYRKGFTKFLLSYTTSSPTIVTFVGKPFFGSTTQLTPPIDNSLLLSPESTKRVKEVVGILLFPARLIISPIFPALSAIGSEYSLATEITAAVVAQVQDYHDTHPNPKLRFKASAMILHIHSDASYLAASRARSRVANLLLSI